MSFNENTPTGSDRESDAARHFPELKKGLVAPEIKRHAMPQMTDGEAFLRLNCPDGLMNNQQQPQKYICRDRKKVRWAKDIALRRSHRAIRSGT